MNRRRIVSRARDLETAAVNVQHGIPAGASDSYLISLCAILIEEAFPLKIGRLELNMPLTARQWKRLEKLSFDEVKKALSPEVHSVEWDGHFGRSLYFRIDNHPALPLTLEFAKAARVKVLKLLGDQ